jgi:Flp pilus assembly protein TadB
MTVSINAEEMDMTIKKGVAATVGVAAACAACCAVPIVATVGIAAVAAPVGVVAAIVAVGVGAWAWLRRRARREGDPI